MNKILRGFTSSDLSSVQNICWLVITGSIFLIALLDFITGEKVIGSATVSMLLLPFFPILLLVKLTSRIKFGYEFIEKTTLTGVTRISLHDVKSFGVYSQLGPFLPKVVDSDDVHRHSPIANNFIFVSTAADFDPINQDIKESIVFGYRKRIYDNVREILSRNNSK